ncbi:DNA polymerase III subunit chi [Pseudocolwellia sp. HL-MZ7]|uniref:DNA polymerase III subunit chi n=1 Tax=Pseudocolwellia sp. HL-MZ7 TaxID=3400627 RepID=UPI003CF3A738
MQTKVMFYVLPETDKTSEETAHNDKTAEQEKHALIHQACLQAAYFYRQNQKVFIYTQDQTQAHDIDEMLWAFEPDSFVAHNLLGEGPRGGSPVEISWKNPTIRRPVLINLTGTMPNFTNNFSTVVDFVPTNELLKQQARDRYRACKQWGFLVESQPAPVIN